MPGQLSRELPACELLPLRMLCSHLAVFDEDTGQACAPRGSRADTATDVMGIADGAC